MPIIISLAFILAPYWSFASESSLGWYDESQQESTKDLSVYNQWLKATFIFIKNTISEAYTVYNIIAIVNICFKRFARFESLQ